MNTMTTRDRCRAVLNFQPFDRLPMLEWAPYWTLTIERWETEGLPKDVDLTKHFGLEPYLGEWLPSGSGQIEKPEDGRPLVSSMDDYHRIREQLYPWPCIEEGNAREIAAKHERGEVVRCFTFEGFFWFPRTLFGIEQHLFAFYDQPEVMHLINSDMAEHHLRCIDEICKYSIPEYMLSLIHI